MRRLLLPTCLFLTAWAQPAGPIFEFTSSAVVENSSVVEKTGPAPQQLSIAAIPSAPETSAETLSRGQAHSDPVALETNSSKAAASASAFDEAGFTTAMFEVPLPTDRPMPVPRNRPVPHRVVCETLAEAAVDNNVPTPFLIRLIWQESRFNQNAVSPVGAQGVAQFMPATAAAMRLADPFNPLAAVRASAALLRDLISQFGNVGLAAAAYNAGPKRVQDWLAKRGSLPKETRDYVQIITGVAPEHWKSKSSAPPVRVAAQVPCQREAGLLAANGPDRIPLPPVANNDNAKPAAKTVQIVAALSQKRKGLKAKAAEPVQVAAKPEQKGAAKQAAKSQARVTLTLIKPEPKSANAKAAVNQAAVAQKGKKTTVAEKPDSKKAETKTVSARSKTKPAAPKTKVANASAK
jgi:soluble lytic murein transglycosylase-like protein